MQRLVALFMMALLASATSTAFAKAPGAGGTCPPDLGAALAAACPCDANSQAQPWKNHGKYASCVVHFRNGLRQQGCLDAQTQRTIARCSARSTCGKTGAVL